jgi:hypothetical protein
MAVSVIRSGFLDGGSYHRKMIMPTHDNRKYKTPVFIHAMSGIRHGRAFVQVVQGRTHFKPGGHLLLIGRYIMWNYFFRFHMQGYFLNIVILTLQLHCHAYICLRIVSMDVCMSTSE